MYKRQVWEISEDGKTLIQPLTSIKGLGMSAIEQVLDNRPFMNAEDLLFREGVSYRKLNKKALDALCRGGALDNIVDDRFSGRKHFWSACIVERPKNLKKFSENLETYHPEGDFTGTSGLLVYSKKHYRSKDKEWKALLDSGCGRLQQ